MDPAVVQQLVDEMGLSGLDTQQREQLIASLGDLMETRVSEVLANRMDDAQFAEFEKLVQAGDPNAVLNYIRMVVPDYDQILRAEMDKIKSEFGAEAAELVASMDEYRSAAAELAQTEEQLAIANQPAEATVPADTATTNAAPVQAPEINPIPANPAGVAQTTPVAPATNPIPPNDFV